MVDFEKYIRSLGFEPVKCLEGGYSHVYQASNEGSSVVVKFGVNDRMCRYDHVITENRVLDMVSGVDGIVEKISFHELEKTADKKLVALVKKYVEGKDLFDAFLYKVSDPNVLTSAVNALHRCGVANLDLFSGNIVIDLSGKPWLIDFGFCVFREDITKRRFINYKDKDLRSLENNVN